MSQESDDISSAKSKLRELRKLIILLLVFGVFYFINIKPTEEFYPSGERLARSDGPSFFDGGGTCGGKKCGNWIFFYKNGQKLMEGKLEHSKKTGPWVYYHENGQKKAEGVYEDNEKIGEWRYWNEDGSLK